jgi:chorismate mutase
MIENIYNGVKIINIEGAWLEKKEDVFEFSTTQDKKFINKTGKEIIIKPNLDKIFTATMPFSLELIRAFDLCKKELLDKNFKSIKVEQVDEDDIELLYTKLFVNFKFTKNPFEYHISKEKLRKLIYTKTVIIDGEEYCFFKRGASKARTANVIFCKKKYHDKLFNPCLLGLKFEEHEICDLTSIGAYTSLIMSGIIGTIKLNSENILIIDDINSPSFKAKQTLTIQEQDNSVVQKEDYYDIINNMTDGEGLMDESIFEENEFINKNTVALLRNDFLKCNAVRTRLQKYYNENGITQVWDMYKGWVDASKIKLVITPSSCKYLKFKNKYKDNSEKCYLDWLKKIPSVYGVVKTDHIGNYGYSNRLSYQMINSLNLSKDDVKEIMKDELDYLKLLKDNTLITSRDLKLMSSQEKKKNKEIRNKMEYFLDSLGTKEELSTGDMINSLLNWNKDYRLTSDFKIYKKHQIQTYINNLRLGKIRIKNSLYAVMVSCPYEMLIATTKEKNKIDNCIMNEWECYCPRFENNARLMSIRNPQINCGNIATMTNVFHDEYKWFGYWEKNNPKFDFVVFVNTYNCDIMNRLQGCDFDIDTTFLCDMPLLVKKAEECKEWATPTNGIKGKSDFKKYDAESFAKLDTYLGGSTMAIGKIVNKSAIFNAYMYHGMNNNKSENYINSCFEASSILSSCSQIAIDMAKKSFLDVKGNPLSLTKIMNSLNKYTYIDENKENKVILEYAWGEGEIDLETYIKDYIKFNEDKESMNYKLLQPIKIDINKYNIDKKNKKLDYYKKTKVKVNMLKMIVPYFFTYTAQDNTYRIPTYMDCGMDYLEQILDEFDTKSLPTNKTKIEELLTTQNSLEGGHVNNEKIDGVRVIINNCNNILNKNYYKRSDDEIENKRKNNLKRNAKLKAISELKSKKLNEKTIHKILYRTFELDENYEGKNIKLLDKNNNEIIYNNKTLLVKEVHEMKSLVLTLLYNAYPELFIKCFKQNKINNDKNKRFWY